MTLEITFEILSEDVSYGVNKRKRRKGSNGVSDPITHDDPTLIDSPPCDITYRVTTSYRLEFIKEYKEWGNTPGTSFKLFGKRYWRYQSQWLIQEWNVIRTTLIEWYDCSGNYQSKQTEYSRETEAKQEINRRLTATGIITTILGGSGVGWNSSSGIYITVGGQEVDVSDPSNPVGVPGTTVIGDLTLPSDKLASDSNLPQGNPGDSHLTDLAKSAASGEETHTKPPVVPLYRDPVSGDKAGFSVALASLALTPETVWDGLEPFSESGDLLPVWESSGTKSISREGLTKWLTDFRPYLSEDAFAYILDVISRLNKGQYIKIQVVRGQDSREGIIITR